MGNPGRISIPYRQDATLSWTNQASGVMLLVVPGQATFPIRADLLTDFLVP